MGYLKPDDVLSPFDRLLAECCRRGWRLVVTRSGMGGYTASVIRGTVALATATNASPQTAMQLVARIAIDKADTKIEKMRAS